MARPRSLASHLAAFIVGAALATALTARALPHPGDAEPGDRYVTLDAFAEALADIRTQHVDDVGERDLLYAAIDGMTRRLDKHSRFYPPAAYRKLREDTEGEFGGVGLELGEAATGASPPWPVVERILPGSPAERAGLALGQRVRSIDGEATLGKPARSWNQVLRGPSGTRVELVVSPATGDGEDDVALVREQVKVPTVRSQDLGGTVHYLAIRRFQEATSADAEAALTAMQRHGQLGALLLDLRGNPGGLLDQGIKVADLFLRDGLIVRVDSRDATSERDVAHADGTFDGFALFVLIDQNTASAAEIVASALQDHHAATVIGLPSYGKGSVQTFFDLADGSGLKLTTARYYTPNGRSLQGRGIIPDLAVEAFEPERIVARGKPRPKEDGGDSSAQPVPAFDPATAEIPPGVSDALRSELEDDYQLRVAYQLARHQLAVTSQPLPDPSHRRGTPNKSSSTAGRSP